jgi:hypothetical protein
MAKGGNRTGGGEMAGGAHPVKAAGLTHGGSKKIGRTLETKAHPTHPSVAFAKPKGGGKGSKAVPDGKLHAPHVKAKYKPQEIK